MVLIERLSAEIGWLFFVTLSFVQKRGAVWGLLVFASAINKHIKNRKIAFDSGVFISA